MTAHRPLFIALAVALAASACSVSEDQEVGLGRSNAEQIDAQLPLITDPAIRDYVQALGLRLGGLRSHPLLEERAPFKAHPKKEDSSLRQRRRAKERCRDAHCGPEGHLESWMPHGAIRVDE